MEEYFKTIQQGPFEPTWESLRQFKFPQWFLDAKFGIWAHWGPQSVPMYGDWYARNIYIEGSPQYYYHWRKYGHPSKVGYKDIVQMWKAENFDPEQLIDLYVKAGAKYFVAQAVHHDNFDNWNSRYHRWNAVNMGPKKDIVGMWCKAARERGLPFGVSEHLAASFSWFAPSKGSDTKGPYKGIPYDGNDQAFEDFYHPNRDEYELEKQHGKIVNWYSPNPQWHMKWFLRIKDLIDQYEPDFLYSDGGVPFGEVGLSIVAHLYNTSAKNHGGINQAVYTQKDTNPDVYKIGVLDIERGAAEDILLHPWQTDTCVGGWFYDVKAVYKTPQQVIEMLIDIVSKGGNLLLNIPQKPDGTLDGECLYILDEIAKWIKVNGEGIYATRPWIRYGEGPTKGQGGAFQEKKLEWTPDDFRFTQKDGKIFAFQMKYPEDRRAIIKSLGLSSGISVKKVKLLGFEDELEFDQLENALVIKLPDKCYSTRYPHCFCIE